MLMWYNMFSQIYYIKYRTRKGGIKMDIDKIIDKMKINRDEKVRESYTCKRGKYRYNDMSVFADGYSDAVKDLVNMVKSQTPPCSGSSVQSKDKFGVFIGDIVELKDGTIGELIFVEKKRKILICIILE